MLCLSNILLTSQTLQSSAKESAVHMIKSSSSSVYLVNLSMHLINCELSLKNLGPGCLEVQITQSHTFVINPKSLPNSKKSAKNSRKLENLKIFTRSRNPKENLGDFQKISKSPKSFLQQVIEVLGKIDWRFFHFIFIHFYFISFILKMEMK